MTVRDRDTARAPVTPPKVRKPPAPPRRTRLIRWMSWVVGVLVFVAGTIALVVLLPETEATPPALAELEQADNPEVFGVAAEVPMVEGRVEIAGVTNPELGSLGSRLPVIEIVAAPTGPALADVSLYDNPEVGSAIAHARIGVVGPSLATISWYENPEVGSALVRLAVSATAPTLADISRYENPEVGSALIHVTVVAPTVAPVLTDLSPYDNPEMFGLGANATPPTAGSTPDPHESPEALRIRP